ncbi:hypothetical protein Btru_041711 [Bulinus truncatus]|nr:hypothetical protein Btru_041711 [Bulinus truncatus]
MTRLQRDATLRIDSNANNASSTVSCPELPLLVLMQLIVAAIRNLGNPKGSTLKDIRKMLCNVGFIDEYTDLRRSMIAGLKMGAIARPVWATKAGIYGIYVEGDGVPIFAGRKSRPKQKQHQSSTYKPDRKQKPKTSNKKERRASTARVNRPTSPAKKSGYGRRPANQNQIFTHLKRGVNWCTQLLYKRGKRGPYINMAIEVGVHGSGCALKWMCMEVDVP